MRTYKLQRRLLLYFILTALVPSLIIAIYYFQNTQNATKNWIIKDKQKQLEHSMELIEKKAQQVNELASWIQQNETLNYLLEKPLIEASGYDYYEFKNQLRMQFYARPITKEIQALCIIGENGLDIRNGQESALIEDSLVKGIVLINNQYYWYSLMDNLTKFSERNNVVVFSCPLPKLANGNNSGNVVILFNEDIFSEELEDLLSMDDSRLILRNSDGGVLFVNGSTPSGNIVEFTTTSLKTGWKLMGKISTRMLDQQKDSALHSIGLLILIVSLIVFGFAIFLSKDMAKPIERIIENVDRISKGDFSHASVVESDNEIGRLSKHIVDMGDSLQRLMQEKLKHERQKKYMEMKILQSQMNPHFLYNTLSSIKMMAILQGKSSIRNIIEMLGKLLRANMMIDTETIPLWQELELIDSYIYIQNISLNGKIRYIKEDIPEELCSIPVIKFILQPIVENAIRYGISPLVQKGNITISAWKDGAAIVLSVVDNGVGMDQKQLSYVNDILEGKIDGVYESQHGNGIGLGNVLSRLRLQYGQESNISIDSSEGNGTTVKLRFTLIGEGS